MPSDTPPRSKADIQARLHAPIDTDAELADMSEEGRQVYRQERQKDIRRNKLVVGAVLALAGAGAVLGYWLSAALVALWAVFCWKFLLDPDRYDAGRLAKARLAEDDGPPERLSWEEHVEKYGHNDGEPLTDEEKQALITGEVDDPEWRREHGFSTSD